MSVAGGKPILHCGRLPRAVKSRLLSGDQPQGRPVEIAVAMRDAGEHPIPYDFDRRHRHTGAVRLGGCLEPAVPAFWT